MMKLGSDQRLFCVRLLVAWDFFQKEHLNYPFEHYWCETCWRVLSFVSWETLPQQDPLHSSNLSINLSRFGRHMFDCQFYLGILNDCNARRLKTDKNTFEISAFGLEKKSPYPNFQTRGRRPDDVGSYINSCTNRALWLVLHWVIKNTLIQKPQLINNSNDVIEKNHENPAEVQIWDALVDFWGAQNKLK